VADQVFTQAEADFLRTLGVITLRAGERREIEKMSLLERKGERRQITFRITPLAEERLKQAAFLFHLTPAQYAKAVLYKDLGLFQEPIDRRKTRPKRRRGLLTWERHPDEKEEEID